MLPKTKADSLTRIAVEQLTQGLIAKMKRMETVREHYDLYNNKTIEADGVYNAPFPYFSNFVDNFQAKIDNPPTCTFKVPNHKTLSDKVKAAWEQERSSTRSAWNRKDRVEKKTAIISGRAISKVYASSVSNKYQSHYDVVDVFSFVADPTRGHLMDGNYHGETDIFKTKDTLEELAQAGFYDKAQVAMLDTAETLKDGSAEIMRGKFDRLKALGVDIETTSFAGQKGKLLTEWVMREGNTWYYLLFDPKTGIWVRAEPLKEVFANGKTPFVSWATHYDEYSFWSKSVADDVAPVTESMRFLINNAIENEKRRTRPMRMVDSGALVDVNELQDYVPDNVILRNPGRDPNVVTIETPDARGAINLIQYLDSTSQAKVGMQDSSVQEQDAKVGIFYGQLQQEADRIGIINKEYSESYAWKGYNFFWGLRQHLTKPKQVEMLGSKGMKLQHLDRVELSDVDDVDDVIVSGGSRQDELDAVEQERQLKVLSELTGAYPQSLNPKWVIERSLRSVGFEQDEVEQALDVEGSVNRELMEEADQAIQDILMGKTPRLNNGADVHFMQRLKDFVTDELNWVKLDKNGKETGIDKKAKEAADRIMAYMNAHQDIVIQNNLRKVRQEQFKQATARTLPAPEGAKEGVNLPSPDQAEQQQALARPFEGPVSTPEGAASTSQAITKTLG